MKSPQDEKLIKDLYEKLNWFTFQAEEEEFDEKQVRAILQLLDTLDPIDFESAAKECMQKGREKAAPADDAAAAFRRFKKKYAVTEADIEKKDRAKIIPFSGSEEASEELAPDMEKIPVMEETKRQTAMDVAAENAEKPQKNVPTAADHPEKLRKNAGKKRRFWNTAGGRAAIAFLSVFTALALTGICTSAVQQKSFFEVVRDGVNSMKITVTGNEMGSETGLAMESSDKIYYESWEEIKAENPEVVVPGYIPEGLELVELYGEEFGNYVRYSGIYEDGNENRLNIRLRYFKEGYAEAGIDNELKYLEEDEGVSYYFNEKIYFGYGQKGTCAYSASWKDLSGLKKIMKEIQ